MKRFLALTQLALTVSFSCTLPARAAGVYCGKALEIGTQIGGTDAPGYTIVKRWGLSTTVRGKVFLSFAVVYKTKNRRLSLTVNNTSFVSLADMTPESIRKALIALRVPASAIPYRQVLNGTATIRATTCYEARQK